MLQNGEKATPVIAELRRQRQEHSLKFKAKLIYISSSRSASSTHQDTVSKLGVKRDLKTNLQRECTKACLDVVIDQNAPSYISNAPLPCNHHLTCFLSLNMIMWSPALRLSLCWYDTPLILVEILWVIFIWRNTICLLSLSILWSLVVWKGKLPAVDLC